MAVLAWLRSRWHVSRRKTTAIRCGLAAVLFMVFFVLHTTNVPRDAAHMIGWGEQTSGQTSGQTSNTDKPATVSDGGSKNEGGNEIKIEDGDGKNETDKGKSVQSDLADKVMQMLQEFPPSTEKPRWGDERFSSDMWHWGEAEPVNVTDRLTLDPAELAKMKKAHGGFVDAVNKRLPEYVPVRHGEDNNKSPTQGIVTVGGGKYFVILTVSLRFLRRTGTTLPVEVFVPENDYEEKVCEEVLPRLNAVCRVYPQMAQPLKGFQLKSFAVLFSSFDEVLLLDADNTAMRDVAPLFSSAPFRSTGFVTWPDFWQMTVSPLYYQIASLDPLPIASRPSTETGQLLVDKTRHWKSLLMAAYYNFYGPTFYYRLLNQGGAGMGDKETFLPGAAVFGLPSYQVRKPVEKVGHRFADGSTGSRVMLQYDAAEDWNVTEALASSNVSLPSNATEQTWKAAYQDVLPVFLHLSWPKWDPTNLLGHISKWSDMTIGVDGQPEPAFHHPPALAAQVKGTERMLWEEALWTACHLRDAFRHWRHQKSATRTCEQLQRHFQRVFDAETGAAIGLGPGDVLFPKLPDEIDEKAETDKAEKTEKTTR